MIFSDSEKRKNALISCLKRKYEITLTPPNKYIGMEIDRATDGTIVISQSQYIREILRRFGMDETNHTKVKTPANTQEMLTSDMSPVSEEEKREMSKIPFREAVGALMFASTVTRLDISLATCKISQFFASFGSGHWKGVKRLFRFLRGTEDMSIAYRKAHSLKMEAYADSSHGGSEGSKSTSGVIITINGSPVHWFARLQKCISLSTTQSEYTAMTEAVKEILWFHSFLSEIGEEQHQPTPLFNDNRSAITLSDKKEVSKRTKHLVTKLDFLREEKKQRRVVPVFTPTDQMPADILTKSLSSPAHERCISQVGMKRKSQRGLK